MNVKIFVSLFFATLFIGLTGCKTKEKLVYFQQGDIDSLSALNNYSPVLKSDDLLSIVISGEDPEAVVPFNLNVTNSTRTQNNGYTNGIPERIGYLIDANGNVALPIIGELKLVDLTRSEAVELIENELSTYINNPIVQIQILNFKITVLGDVSNPGTFKIPNERITLLEAIGLAGDLNITGNRKNVLVIRDNNGTKQEYRVDLTSNKVFTSSAYYLSQNDVVYVEPNSAARSSSTVWRTSGSIFISVAALLITTVSVITK